MTPAPRIAIIGSGFAGLGMAYYLKQAGFECFSIFEKSETIGGVWRDNSYPGAACDVPSHLYSYSFEPHYPWSCRYGHRDEILEYQQHVARKHDLLRHVQFSDELIHADYDAARGIWTLRFASGATHACEVLITATGQLHRPQIPQISGQEKFRGPAFHSARWDHGYDFAGKTVAVIGTGASAVQFVPMIAQAAARLHVFQRSPGWCIPKFDKPFSGWQRRMLDRVPLIHDLDRLRIFGLIEFFAAAMVGKSWLGKLAESGLKLSSKLLLWLQVRDPALRKKLTPEFPIGCKRTLLSNDWLKTLARPNVEVVTEAVSAISATGVVTTDGRERTIDAIIYGTGFAATQFLAPMRICGAQGQLLSEIWRDGAQAYLGVSVAGFPNFFMMYGPNTNLGAGSIIYMLERQSRYIVQCLRALRDQNLHSLEVRAEVQAAFNTELQTRSKQTTYESGCHSWYINASGRNTNNWVGHMTEYGHRLHQLNFQDYRAIPHAKIS